MKIWRRLIVGVVVAGAGIGFWYYRSRPVAVTAPEILRAAVSQGSITETVQAMGIIEPRRRVNVGSQISGVVKEMYVDFNSVVKEGQLLAEIESSQFEIQVEVQQANYARQTSDIATQELQLKDLKAQLQRVEALFAKDLQTEQQLDAVRLAVQIRESQIASAKKQLVQAEAALNAAKLNLSYTKIYSPIDGVVINRSVDKGQTVQASMRTPNFFLLSAPFETLRLTAGVDEADIGRVRPGMTVKFRVSTFGPQLFTGTVDTVRLNASRTNEVVTYPVWIRVPNEDLRLRPGMTATVFIEVSRTAEVARIPNEALKFRPTRAVYAALGMPAPETDTVRAVDRAGDTVVDPTALRTFTPDQEADTVDELFGPPPKADARATVWTFNDTTKEFKSIAVRVGVSDGTMTELLSGEIKSGDQLVTKVILPLEFQRRSSMVGEERKAGLPPVMGRGGPGGPGGNPGGGGGGGAGRGGGS